MYALPPSYYRPPRFLNPYRNPLGPVAVVGLSLLAVAVVGGVAYFAVRTAKAATAGSGKGATPIQIADSKWDSGERVKVPLGATIRTTGWTLFPSPQFGIVAGQLADGGASMDGKIVKSEMYTGGAPSNKVDLEIYTGSVSGPVEALLQSGQSDRTELKLQLGP